MKPICFGPFRGAPFHSIEITIGSYTAHAHLVVRDSTAQVEVAKDLNAPKPTFPYISLQFQAKAIMMLMADRTEKTMKFLRRDLLHQEFQGTGILMFFDLQWIWFIPGYFKVNFVTILILTPNHQSSNP